MGIYSGFYFRPSSGEAVSVSVTASSDGKTALCGRIEDEDGCPCAGAVVLLLRREDDAPGLMELCFADGDGYFAFGPLEPDELYIIKVFSGDGEFRELRM